MQVPETQSDTNSGAASAWGSTLIERLPSNHEPMLACGAVSRGATTPRVGSASAARRSRAKQSGSGWKSCEQTTT